MDLDDALARCLALPGALETYPFGDGVAVIKVAGRMFALLPLDAAAPSVSLKCDPDLATALRGRCPAVTPGYHLSNPAGYCPDHGTGVSCPVGLFAPRGEPGGAEG